MQPTVNPQPPAPVAGPPFAAAIGLGAFLLLLVQFITGKLILPWFGGAAAVWTTCMLFFQVGLLLGYGYAHLLTSYLSPRSRSSPGGPSAGPRRCCRMTAGSRGPRAARGAA